MASEPDVPASGSSRHGVALLLAAAAIVAAIVTTRATFLTAAGGSDWQRSVGQEQRRGAILLEEVRFIYEDEADMAFLIAIEEARADELRAASASAAPELSERLVSEARVHEEVAAAMRASSVLGTDQRYSRPTGAFDLEQALADRRAEDTEALAIDPLGIVASGDRASDHGIRLLATTLLIGVAFLLGSLAQVARSRRRPMLVLGWLAVLAAMLSALAIEVTA